MGNSDFSLDDKKSSPVMFDDTSAVVEDPFSDLLIAGAAPPIASPDKPIKLHAPHFEPHSPHHTNYFLKDLKRAQPFKQSQLYPPANSVNSLQPLDLMKMMNIELKPKHVDEATSSPAATTGRERIGGGTSASPSPDRVKPIFDDEDDDGVDDTRSAAARQQQQPSPMQVVVNYKPKQSISEEGSHQDPAEAVNAQHVDTATNSTVLDSSMNTSVAEESDNVHLEEQLYELQQVEQLANEEVLSSIAHIQQVHGPSPATSRALGAASMLVATGSLNLARKKSSFMGALKFSKSSSRRKFDRFVLGEPTHSAKSRQPTRVQQLTDSVANNQKLFNWEDIDLFKVDEEDSFLLHSFKFEDDVTGGQSIKSHTFVNAANGQQREIVPPSSQVSSEDRRASTVVMTQEKMLNNQIKELLQSEVVVILEEVPIVAPSSVEQHE